MRQTGALSAVVPGFRMKKLWLPVQRLVLPLALLLALIVPSLAAQVAVSNKWRLEFSGAAESAGEMVFEIVPSGQPPVRVVAVIERNDGENRVARKVKTAIDRQAGMHQSFGKAAGKPVNSLHGCRIMHEPVCHGIGIERAGTGQNV